MNDRVAIGQRLLDERKRLGLTQEACGLTPQVFRRYENGKSTPGADYLAELAALGFDVMYVITGNRSVGVVTDEEAKLLEAFRRTPEVVRQAVMAALVAGAGNAPAPTIAAPVEQLPAGKGFTSEERRKLEEKAGIRPRSEVGAVRKGRLSGK